jgi:hypothetical protein
VWDWYFYVATKQLGFTEERFWRMTLRKLIILWKQHCEFNNNQPKVEEAQSDGEVHIDEMSFWDL